MILSMNDAPSYLLCAIAALTAALLSPPASFAEAQTADRTIQELNVLIQEINGEIRMAEQEIRKIENNIAGIEQEIQKNDAIIRSTEEKISEARAKKNTAAETAFRDAQEGARRAKKKGEDTRAEYIERLKKHRAALEAARARESKWKDDTRKLIADQLAAGRDPLTQAIMSSLNNPSNGLRPLFRPFTELRAGDVLLVAPDEGLGPDAIKGKSIKLFDKASSWEKGTSNSRASHTLICLKTVNGKKFFLDNQSGEGPRIKTEDQILREYGARPMDVARPLAEVDGRKLWEAARELEMKNLARFGKGVADETGYGLRGDDNKVCSEVSQWVLIRAGVPLPDTDSPFKKSLGIYFGPADFYRQDQHFLISAVELPMATEPAR
jgi:hypothetical protein